MRLQRAQEGSEGGREGGEGIVDEGKVQRLWRGKLNSTPGREKVTPAYIAFYTCAGRV